MQYAILMGEPKVGGIECFIKFTSCLGGMDPTPSINCFANLSSLLNACGTQIWGYRQDQSFLVVAIHESQFVYGSPHYNQILPAWRLDKTFGRWMSSYLSFGYLNVIVWLEFLYLIGPVGRVFANDPGDLGSIPVHVIPKTLKMVLDTSLLNTQQYKVRIKGKVEQSRERSSALPYPSVK